MTDRQRPRAAERPATSPDLTTGAARRGGNDD
jgi:hypothetical protein